MINSENTGRQLGAQNPVAALLEFQSNTPNQLLCLLTRPIYQDLSTRIYHLDSFSELLISTLMIQDCAQPDGTLFPINIAKHHCLSDSVLDTPGEILLILRPWG